MGLTGSNSGVFRVLGFIVSPVGKRERRRKKEKGRKEKGVEKERMEGWEEGAIKNDQRKDKKKEF